MYIPKRDSRFDDIDYSEDPVLGLSNLNNITLYNNSYRNSSFRIASTETVNVLRDDLLDVIEVVPNILNEKRMRLREISINGCRHRELLYRNSCERCGADINWKPAIGSLCVNCHESVFPEGLNIILTKEEL